MSKTKPRREPKRDTKRETTNASVFRDTHELALRLQLKLQADTGLSRVNMLEVYGLAVREACERRGMIPEKK